MPPVAGVTCWYDASAITGVADGAAVSSVSDLSGNAYHLTTGTATYYKTTGANLINGHPALWFDGSTTYLQSTATVTFNALPFTVQVVLREAAATGTHGIMTNSDNSAAAETLSTLYRQVWFNNLGQFGTRDTSAHVLSFVCISGNSSIRKDGTVLGTNSTAPGGVATNSPICIGSLWSTGSPFNGAIGEILVYSGVSLSPTDIAANETYLTNKWLAAAPPTGTVSAPLGPLTVTGSGAPSTPVTATLPLGPLTVAATSTSFTPYGTANVNTEVDVRAAGLTHCARQAWLTLPGRLLLLEDPASGYFCQQLDLGSAEIREVKNYRPDTNGTIDRTQYMGSRAVTANITALAGAGARIDTVAAAFAPYMTPSARPVLHYVLDRPGYPERTLTVRAAGFSWPVAGNNQRDLQLQWVAPDPVAYDPAVKTVTGSTTSVGTISPAGDVPVRPLIRLTGPVTHPVIKMVPSDGTVWYLAFPAGYTLAAGHHIDLDLNARTVYYDSDPARPLLAAMDWTQTSWQWVNPAPSSTDMSLTGTATSGATLVTATWQDGYLT
jgi:hypothetical protein